MCAREIRISSHTWLNTDKRKRKSTIETVAGEGDEERKIGNEVSEERLKE